MIHKSGRGRDVLIIPLRFLHARIPQRICREELSRYVPYTGKALDISFFFPLSVCVLCQMLPPPAKLFRLLRAQSVVKLDQTHSQRLRSTGGGGGEPTPNVRMDFFLLANLRFVWRSWCVSAAKDPTIFFVF